MVWKISRLGDLLELQIGCFGDSLRFAILRNIVFDAKGEVIKAEISVVTCVFLCVLSLKGRLITYNSCYFRKQVCFCNDCFSSEVFITTMFSKSAGCLQQKWIDAGRISSSRWHEKPSVYLPIVYPFSMAAVRCIIEIVIKNKP